MTREELSKLTIIPPDPAIEKLVKSRWDTIAKPLDSMGRFETILSKIGAISGSTDLCISSKAVLIMCADNGITEEGISQSGQEVTAIVAENMLKGQSSVCKMAAAIGADIFVIDIGINRDMPMERLVHKKMAYGTKNFLKEPAMSEHETMQALNTGIELVELCKKKGYKLLATGEMGIGNTTTSSAVTAALLGCKIEVVTGKGAGLSKKRLVRKQEVIKEAIAKYGLRKATAFDILRTVGGLDLAGLAGVFIGGALHRIPIVIDGAISAAAALVAERLVPGVRAFMIASHLSKEPTAGMILAELGLQPVITADMALGEGTGAVMMCALLDTAHSVYQNQTEFQDIGIEKYERYPIGGEE